MTVLEFQRLASPVPGLPVNYLPVGLPALQGVPAGLRHPLFAAPFDRQPPLIPDKDLANPVAVSETTASFLSGQSRPHAVYLGPAVTGAKEVGTLLPALKEMPSGAGPKPVALGIIDAGIAFWNPRLRDAKGGPAFQGLGCVHFDTDGTIDWRELQAGALAKLCGLSEPALLDDLAAWAPRSVYGPRRGGPLFRRDGASHGTAMADCALRSARAGSAEPRLFGVELPAEVLQDSTGHLLEAVVPLAIRNLVKLILDHPAHAEGVNIVLMLPFAYTGGPHHADHPSVRAITDTLPSGVKLVLPTGNHLQDRLHARLSAGAPLVWHLPPDDASENIVELSFGADEVPTLHLAAPNGTAAEMPLAPDMVALLCNGGMIVGALHVGTPVGDAARVRLCLAPTRSRGPRPAAPAGDWQLTLTSAGKAWILRDDYTRPGPDGPQRRPSWFRDAGYRKRDGGGRWLLDDPDPQPAIRRRGSASILVNAKCKDVVVVGARERAGATERRAWYSGIEEGSERETVLVDAPWPNHGQWALGNGGRQLFRISGTSVAVALKAGDLAAKLSRP